MNRTRAAAGIAILLASGLLVACGESAEMRRTSLYQLQRERGVEAADEVRAFLVDEDPDVRATALNVLVGLRVDDAADLCVQALNDESGFVRSMGAKLLGDLNAISHVSHVAERLYGDSDPWVRQRAAEALSEIGDAASVEALQQGMSDPIQTVRKAAIAGIRATDPESAKPQLARIVIDDASWECRVQAARALGLTGDSEYIPALTRALDDSNEFVRAAAGHAIRLITGEPAQPASEAKVLPSGALGS